MIIRQLAEHEKRCEIPMDSRGFFHGWGGGCDTWREPYLPCGNRPQWMVDGKKLCTTHMKQVTFDSVFVETGRFRSVVVLPAEAYAVDLRELLNQVGPLRSTSDVAD